MDILADSEMVFVLGSYVSAQFLAVAMLPVAGQSQAAHKRWSVPGGKGLNLAVGLKRAGFEVHLQVAVGDDEAGRQLRQLLPGLGLTEAGLLCLGSQSGYGVALVNPEGDNMIAVFPGANALLSGEHVLAAQPVLQGCSWLCAQFELEDEPIATGFALARRLGVKTYLNPSPWRTLSPALLALTDLLIVNETEAGALFQLAAPLPARDWQAQLPSLAQGIGWQGLWLVVTLGAAGSVALDAKGLCHFQAAYEITQADASGAGDAYGSGLLRCLQSAMPLADAMQYASACGAMVAAEQGILDLLPAPAQVLQFMRAKHLLRDQGLG